MNYKKESQFTNNASKRVWEEVYTNEDMTSDKIDVSNGNYRLRTPQMFAVDLSQEKAISPRRVMCEPNSHTFFTRISFFISQTSNLIGSSDFIAFDFTGQNTLEECLNHMRNSLKFTDNGTTYGINYNYDKLRGILNIWALDNLNHSIDFRFECFDYNNYNELWHLFNQQGNPFFSVEDNQLLYNTDTLAPSELINLNNVWSREPLYVHASFSRSKKRYLCRTGDFWFKPSKYYYDNIANDEFFLFFTTDTTHWIIPYDAVKVIELCFILRQFARL